MTDYHWELLRLERLAMTAGLLPDTPRAWRRQWNREAWAMREPDARKEPRTPRSQRPLCGARTRKGTPCKARVVSGSTRCRVHGGLSTGPKSEEGRAAVAKSNRRRVIMADLVELEPAMDDDRRRQWAAAILELAAGGSWADAGEAAGVTATTIARWSEDHSFRAAKRRARARTERRQRATERCVHNSPAPEMPMGAPLAGVPDLDLDLPDFELPAMEDLDLDALLADVPSIEDLDLDALLAGLELPDLDSLKIDLAELLDGIDLEGPTWTPEPPPPGGILGRKGGSHAQGWLLDRGARCPVRGGWVPGRGRR